MTIVLSGDTGITTPMYNGAINSNAVTPSVNMKNRCINGGMLVAQRGTSAVTANDSYAVDRWNIGNTTDGAFSAVQDSDAPAGFNKSVKFTITTADASVTGTQSLFMVQVIEGLNIADLNWGTANAKTVTLSFQVKSSVTGTFSGSLVNSALDRSYPFTYSIASANTWTSISVTVAGDTSGTWLTDNGAGIRVYFSLGTGSTRLGTAGTWGSSRFQGATGETALVNTLNATWFITGIQLEVGSTATSFDYRPYGTELALCQRYFQTYGYGVNGTTGDSCIGTGMFYTSTEIIVTAEFKVIMRAVPTYSATTVTSGYRYHRAGANTSIDSLPYSGSSSTSAAIFGNISLPVGGTAGYATQIYAQASGAKINFSAEL